MTFVGVTGTYIKSLISCCVSSGLFLTEVKKYGWRFLVGWAQCSAELCVV